MTSSGFLLARTLVQPLSTLSNRSRGSLGLLASSKQAADKHASRFWISREQKWTLWARRERYLQEKLMPEHETEVLNLPWSKPNGLGPGESDTGNNKRQNYRRMYLLASEINSLSFLTARYLTKRFPIQSKRSSGALRFLASAMQTADRLMYRVWFLSKALHAVRRNEPSKTKTWHAENKTRTFYFPWMTDWPFREIK